MRGLLSTVVLAAVGAFAQETSPPAQPVDGQRIREIRFEPSAQSVPDAELRQILPIKPGDAYSGLAVREAMRILFRTGRFTNLTVDAQQTGGEIILTFATELNEYIGNVDVAGAPGVLPRGGLIGAAKLALGTPFDVGALNQATESIETELRLNGFYESKVTYTLERDDTHRQVDIRFAVESGKRAKFTTPIFRGNLLLSEDKLIKATRWKRFYGLAGWSYISEQKVQNGIRGILQAYRKQEHLMAKTVLDRLDFRPQEMTAVPSLRVDAGPKVRVRSVGMKISKTNLRKLVPIYEEQSVDRDLLIEGNRKLSAFLRAKGYFDASVAYEVEQSGQAVEDIDPKKDAFIDYQIDRGPRYKVAALSVSGNSYFIKETILERMAVKPSTILRYRRGRYSDELLAGDRAAIEDLYRSNGFLNVKVTSAVDRRTGGKAPQVAINVNIAEGPQTIVESLVFEGIAESDRPILEALVTSTAGQPYSVLTINADRERILNRLYQSGYSEATFEARAERGSQAAAIRLVYTVNGGIAHFVRDVLVTGLKTTNSSLVNKRIRLKPGDPLSGTEVFASQRRLYDLGIFARVDTAQQNPDGFEISKTILFNLEEASRLSFNGGVGAEIARIGGGVTTLDSPAGGTGFSPRISFGVNRTNFLGLGHTIGAQTRLSNIQRRILLTYLAPQFRDSDRFSLTATALYDDARNVRTFNSTRLEGSLQIAQRLNRANSAQYRFTFRNVDIDPDTIKIDPALIPILAQPVRVGSFSTTFIQDRRDDPVDAKRGRYTTVDVGVASKAFYSSTNFTRLLARNSSYYRIGRDIVFARSLNFGILTPYAVSDDLTSLTDIPLPERFFGGGAYSHRGFPENQAGPRDLKTGFPLGGKAILVNNLEVRFPLVGDNLGGVFFHDAGNIYSDIKNVSLRFNQRDLKDFDYMVHAVGFGVRYRTPIGPVRIDLALSPNSPRFNGFEGSREDLLFGRGRETQLRVNQFQFHISLGQAF